MADLRATWALHSLVVSTHQNLYYGVVNDADLRVVDRCDHRHHSRREAQRCADRLLTLTRHGETGEVTR